MRINHDKVFAYSPEFQSALTPHARSPRSKTYRSSNLRHRRRPGDMVGFSSIIDPQSILKLIEIAGTGITDEKVHAPHEVIVDLGAYVRPTPPGPDAMKLLSVATLYFH
ncbi:MAG: hypothetical protein JWM30_3910 [Burkholderia sp.]|jgi:hypothetical protein|nr:hypothetical protein [Burkholderia sp.]